MSVSEKQYPKGSEWRKWDLHIHTPYSALNNGFGQDFDIYAKTVLLKAVERGIAAIGITDYFLLDGYLEMRRLLADVDRMEGLLGVEAAEKARQIAIFPNIELRSSVLVTHGDETGRVNFHVVFDPDIEPSAIDEHFLRDLHFTAQANPSSVDEKWSVTRENLQALGNRLKDEHQAFASQTDLVVGMTNAVVTHEDVTSVLERQRSRFANRYLMIVPVDEDLSEISWDSQGHQTRKVFIQKAHMLFSGSPGTREFGLGRRHDSVDAFLGEFRTLKACVHGSDAHSYESLFEPALGRYLWIKADPTFQGLRQLLFEPETRVYIGQEPPALSIVRERATKYMDSITFNRTTRAREDAEWFSGNLPLNHGLIAIIGNKGSGKSALSDILALLADTRSCDYFSFLTPSRFLSPRAALGGMFSADVHWQSGQVRHRALEDPVDLNASELVKYIPQHFLETVCSELQESSETQFDRELMEVIFSHVGPADRLGKETLAELIDYLTKETSDLLEQLQLALGQINQDILDLEAQQTQDHRKTLEAQLAQRKADLEAHVAARPVDMPEPSADPEQQGRTATAKDELERLVKAIQDLDRLIADASEEARVTALVVAAADRLLTRIDNLERQLEAFHAESAGDGNVLDIDTRSLVALSVDRAAIASRRSGAEERNAIAKSLLVDEEGSLPRQRDETSAKTAVARSKLDEPTRLYQEHLRKLAGWQKRCDEIEGSTQIAQSVSWLEAKLEALTDLPRLVNDRKRDRLAIVADIFAAKARLLAAYQKLYSPVQAFIDDHPVAQQQATLQFSASIAVDDFAGSLLNMIHQGRRGSFQGDREGRELLDDLLAVSDFSTLSGVNAFLTEVEGHLTHDKRGVGGGNPVRLSDQLRQDWKPRDVYGFLYGLEYLRPRFELLWQGKPIDRLSPGERGNLLLIFYLLIDRRDIPLVIDQPEENLDNHTIATALIPALKYAKERRQIIIVTHNPNLAVVCDAEQIIHAHMDKSGGNKVLYTAGGIENPGMAKLVVDVLEGTKPAFDIRDAKYEVLERLA